MRLKSLKCEVQASAVNECRYIALLRYDATIQFDGIMSEIPAYHHSLNSVNLCPEVLGQ